MIAWRNIVPNSGWGKCTDFQQCNQPHHHHQQRQQQPNNFATSRADGAFSGGERSKQRSEQNEGGQWWTSVRARARACVRACVTAVVCMHTYARTHAPDGCEGHGSEVECIGHLVGCRQRLIDAHTRHVRDQSGVGRVARAAVRGRANLR